MQTLNLNIGILRNYDYPDLLRQSPDLSGNWGNIKFQVDTICDPCDVVVVCNYVTHPVKVECREVWLVVQESPAEHLPWIYDGHEKYDRIFSPIIPIGSKAKYITSHGALPWHVDASYDYLNSLALPLKTHSLSWVTSNKSQRPGHKKRLNFLRKIQEAPLEFDLFGHGFSPIKNKLDGLLPYRYSLVVENFSGPDYWTEKLADCFLSWTMPICYGCTNLSNYFPKNSFVQIDIDSPNIADEIEEIIKSDVFEKNKEAILEARRLIMQNYQLFPFLEEYAQKVFVSDDLQKIRSRTLMPYKKSIKYRFLNKIRRYCANKRGSSLL